MASKSEAVGIAKVMEFREVVDRVVPMLASRNIKVTQNGTQAYVKFDAKGVPFQVNIPYIPDTASVKTFEAIRGYLDHEVAHLLFTDFEGFVSKNAEWRKRSEKEAAAKHTLTNILEDIRIEKLMGERFPGSRQHITDVITFVYDRYVAQALNEAVVSGESKQIKQILYMPMFRAWGEQYHAKEFMNDKWSLIDDLASKLSEFKEEIPKLQTTEDVIDLAERIYDKLKETEPPPKEEPSPSEGESGDSEDKEDEGDSSDSGDDDAGSPPIDTSDDDEKPSEKSEGEESSEGDPSDDEEKDEESDNKDDEGDKSESSKDKSDDKEEEDSDKDGSESEGSKDDDSEDEESEGDSDGDEESDEEDGDGDDEGSSGDTDDDETDDEGEDGKSSKSKDGEAEGDESDSESEPEGSAEDSAGASGTDADFLDDLGSVDPTKEAINKAMESEYDYGAYLPFSTEFDHWIDAKIENKHINITKAIRDMDNDVRNLTGQLQTHLIRLLAQRDQIHNYGGQRRGRLQSSALHRLIANDDRVFSIREEVRAMNTAVQLVIDCSGSMSGTKIKVACQSAYALGAALERANIPFEIVGFTTYQTYEFNEYYRDNSIKIRGVSRFSPIQMIAFKPFDRRFDTEAKAVLSLGFTGEVNYDLSQNVDGESLLMAAPRLLKRQEQRKIMMVLSDGDPCDMLSNSSLLNSHLKRAINFLEKNIEVLGIGITSTAVERFYKKNIVIKNVGELPNLVIKELSKFLLK